MLILYRMLRKGWHDLREGAVGFMGSLNLAARYVFAGFSREKSGLCVGIGTIVLVVGFLTVLQATVSQSSLIFLKLAEDSVGENDIVRGCRCWSCVSSRRILCWTRSCWRIHLTAIPFLW
jgi:hypothetical protein